MRRRLCCIWRADQPAYCLTFLFCAFTVYSDLETMGNSAFLSKKINTELDRLEEVTDIPKMDTSSEKLVVSHYDISLEHISFGYGGRQVIHDISLEIPEHTTCAIVGPSGSGKTTLCNLIARFWDVQEGTVRIGGKNVRDYTADSVLEYISMVFQNVYLFHDSVENNIRFGRPEATREQVIAAAKRACCHDFILSLPDGTTQSSERRLHPLRRRKAAYFHRQGHFERCSHHHSGRSDLQRGPGE